MNTNKFSEAIGQVGEKYYEEAAGYQPKQKKRIRIKMRVLAACFCLVVIGAFTVPLLFNRGEQIDPVGVHGDPTVENVGFTMDGKLYFPITFDERKLYNLVPQDAGGLTKENTYIITSNDLGAQMGVVEECPDENLVGKQVYYFSLFPDDDRICIVDFGGSYAFYVIDSIV